MTATPDSGPKLAIGQSVVLRLRHDGQHALPATIERYDAAGRRLTVEWPLTHLRLFPVRAGQTIGVEYSRPGDALYRVDSMLESASTEEPPMLVLSLAGDWQRAQRRETERHPVEVRPSSAIRFAVDGEHVRLEPPLVLDLSTGGLRVQADSELTIDDELELTFGTPSGGAQLRLRMTVLRVDRQDGLWDAGCQFVESSLNEREQIVGFILGSALSS